METSYSSTMEQALSVFKKHWGFDGFRDAQEDVLKAIFNDDDVLAILPTGYGKSALFQVPAMVYNGVALVVSPLIALMKDQADDCNKRDIPASYINSHVSEGEAEIRLKKLVDGEYKVFYIAPERIRNHSFCDALKQTSVSLLVIDEAHCASRWGHDFRPSYMRIHEILKLSENDAGIRPQVLAVTATATEDIEEDIAQSIGMSKNYKRIVGDPIRSNLNYMVLNGNEWRNLAWCIKNIDISDGRYIFYSSTRKAAEMISDKVKAKFGSVSGVYHAGLDKENREKVQDAFKSGELRVVCATNAFGMGIDVPDIRGVYHFGIPSSVEDYCQEAGRAGRDGKESGVILIKSTTSIKIQQMFLDGSNPPVSSYRHVWKYLHDNLKPDEVMKKTAITIAEEINQLVGTKVVTDNQISGCLSTLESYEYVTRQNLPPEIKMLVHFDKIKNDLAEEKIKRNQKLVAEHLIEKYHFESDYDIIIPLSTFAENIDLPEVALKRTIKSMEVKGYVKQEPTFRGKSTTIKKYGAELDKEFEKKIEAKRSREMARLQRVIDYTESNDKIRFIRDYFLGK